MSGPEIDEVIASLGIYLGKVLQSVTVSDRDIALGFWEGRRVIWLWMDLQPERPVLLPLLDLPLSPPLKKKPLQLFLKAHFTNEKLVQIERVAHMGRLVLFVFENGRSLEFRMIPRGVNVIATTSEKKISLFPVKNLPASTTSDKPPGPSRTLLELMQEWKTERFKPKAAPKVQLDKRLDGVKRSLTRVRDEIASKQNSPWRALGNWLVEHQSLEVPEEYASLIDRRRKLAWNIEQCFEKAKDVERKLEGTKAREKELKEEIRVLEERMSNGDWADQPDSGKKAKKVALPPSRALRLTDQIEVVVGKSAKDNIDLLRKARAWDLWLHVKDQPSAHAVIFRPKNATISDELLRKAASWLIRLSLGQKHKDFMGERFEILCAECRHVSPIKGDKLGRVTYRNERVMTVRL